MANLGKVAKLRALRIDNLREMNAHLACEGEMLLQKCEEAMAFQTALRHQNFEIRTEYQRLLQIERQFNQVVPPEQREAMERGAMGRGSLPDQFGDASLQEAVLIDRVTHQRQQLEKLKMEVLATHPGECKGEIPDSLKQKGCSPRTSVASTHAADLVCSSGRPSTQLVVPTGVIPPTNPIEHPAPWIVDNASLSDPASDLFINARTSDFTGLQRFSC